MAEGKAEEGEAGTTLGRLASRGEGALRRIVDELEKNERTHDAVQKLGEARGKLEKVSRSMLRELGIAPLDEVEKLQKEVHRLERKVAKLEKQAKAGAAETSSTEAGPGS